MGRVINQDTCNLIYQFMNTYYETLVLRITDEALIILDTS